MPLDRPPPPYQQIADELRERIRRGDLAPGDRVPSVRDLVSEYEVAMATAQKALGALQAEGWVRPERGIGNLVTTEAERGWSAAAWLEKARRTGRIYPEGRHARIVEAELTTATEQIAGALGVDVGAQVIRRLRVSYHGDEPVSSSTSWFSGAHAEIAPRLLVAERIPEGSFLYLATRLGHRVARWQDQYEPVLATAEDAQLLDLAEGTAVNHGRNWVYDDTGEVLEYGESVSAGRIAYRGEIDD